MATLVFDTPNLMQVYDPDDRALQNGLLFVFSEEPFSIHVNNGHLLVKSEPTARCYVDPAGVLPFFETINTPILKQKQEDRFINPLIGISTISFAIDEDSINAEAIKFRRILPWRVYDLSEIEYHGKRYKGIRH